MRGEWERRVKWSDTGEVETLMNNLKWILCSLKEFSLSVLQPRSVTLCVHSTVDWRGDTLSPLLETLNILLNWNFQLKLCGTAGSLRMIPYFCLLLCWLALPLQGNWTSAYSTKMLTRRQVDSSLYHKVMSLLCQIPKRSQKQGCKIWAFKQARGRLTTSVFICCSSVGADRVHSQKTVRSCKKGDQISEMKTGDISSSAYKNH